MLDTIFICFDLIDDRRLASRVLYPLKEILFCLIIGNLCNTNDLEDIVYLCKEKLEFLRKYLPYKNGIASVATFQRVLEVIDYKHFSNLLTAIIADYSEQLSDILAIDGKSIRGSGESKSDIVHLVSAYSCENGLVVAQEKVGDKTNEIKAIPDLLRKLNLKGTVTTIDAMGCQKDIVKQIVAQKGDYFIGLKGNQGSLYEDVKLFFQEKNKEVQSDSHNNTDFGHGRIEERCCTATSDIKWLQENHPDWYNLKTIVEVRSKVTNKKTKKESLETRYYITSLPADAAKNLHISRAHWAIENNVHWCLDVIWREDAQQIKNKNAATNLATTRKIAYNLLKINEEKIPLKRKRLKATLNEEFLNKLLTMKN